MKRSLMKSTCISLLMIIGSFVFLVPKAEAATKSVCASCAYTTIQAAIDASASGDIIEVSSGNYAGFNVTGANNITIKGTGLPVVTSAITLSSTGTVQVLGFNTAGTTITATAGKVTLLNNKIGTVTASGAAAVDAKGNYWGETPEFTTLITKSGTATVTYEPYYTIEKMLGSNITAISLKTTTKTIEVGDKYTAELDITYVGDYTITWTSSDETKATVDSNGVITAMAEGTATITATTTYGDTFTIGVEVVCEGKTENPKTSVELYIVAFGALVLIGGYVAIQTFKKSKEMM